MFHSNVNSFMRKGLYWVCDNEEREIHTIYDFRYVFFCASSEDAPLVIKDDCGNTCFIWNAKTVTQDIKDTLYDMADCIVTNRIYRNGEMEYVLVDREELHILKEYIEALNKYAENVDALYDYCKQVIETIVTEENTQSIPSKKESKETIENKSRRMNVILESVNKLIKDLVQ